MGFEPTTLGSTARCSTTELRSPFSKNHSMVLHWGKGAPEQAANGPRRSREGTNQAKSLGARCLERLSGRNGCATYLWVIDQKPGSVLVSWSIYTLGEPHA